MRVQERNAVNVDHEACAARLEHEIERLSRPPLSSHDGSVTRYAFTDGYLHTLEHLSQGLEELGFGVHLDAVGNLVARNCPLHVPAVGLGSHCDSVRGGGKFDGILGVLAAVEVARISEERGIGLPLQVIAWVEEEASGFGQMLLGSRAASGLIDVDLLRTEVRALDDGRLFADHARAAGLDPACFADCRATLSGLSAWIELHIEQGRVLEGARERIGVVDAIAGYVHADIELRGRPRSRRSYANGEPAPRRRRGRGGGRA